MTRTLLKLALLSLMVIAGAGGLYTYERRNSIQIKLDAEKERTRQLKEVVAHLQAERRVADIIVTDQHADAATGVKTTLLFVEYAKDGSPLPAKRFVIDGDQAHIDALVVKFEGSYVENRDPLRGQSVALFTRLFGDKQSPEQAHRIDDPAQIPAIYRGVSPEVSEFEKDLWHDFWKLADDEAYRKSMGVRVVQGESVFRPFKPGKLYTITLENDGGLNIASEPLKGIYSEALKRIGESKLPS